MNVNSADEAYKLLTIGQRNLKTACTKLNHNSSRRYNFSTLLIYFEAFDRNLCVGVCVWGGGWGGHINSDQHAHIDNEAMRVLTFVKKIFGLSRM